MNNIANNDNLKHLGFYECNDFDEKGFRKIDIYEELVKLKKSEEEWEKEEAYIESLGFDKCFHNSYTTMKEIEQVRWHISQIHTDFEKSIIFNFIRENEEVEKQIGYKIKDLTDKDIAEIIDMSRLKKLNTYMSQNTFLSTYKRTKEWVWRSGAIVVDVDFHKLKKYKHFTPEGILAEIESKYPEELQPSYAYSTGRGLCLVFLLQSIPLYKFNKNKGLWEKVFKALVDKYKEFGADDDAKGLSRVNRIPTSINRRNKKSARILYYDEIKDKSLKRYSLIELSKILLEHKKVKDIDNTNEQPQLINNKQDKEEIIEETKPQSKYRFNPHKLAKARKIDFDELLRLRHNDIEGIRNTFFHLYSLIAFDIYNSIDKVKEVVYKANNRLIQPLGSSELDKTINSSYLSYRRKKEGQTGYYSYKNQNIIQLLKITGKEMANMKTLINNEVKNDRRKTKNKEKRRNENGLTEREQQKENIFNAIKELYNEGCKQKNIAEKLNISKGRVSQIVKEIKTLQQ